MGVGVVVVAALLALLGSLAAAPSTPADGAQLGPPVVAGQVYVAQSGDTYWSIAARLGAGGDVRATVDALEAANEGRLLRAGDRLELPP
ncbi:MAG: LysM peptidoglycan-binding domain-containing protein [Acidimicrobiales bacterium]